MSRVLLAMALLLATAPLQASEDGQSHAMLFRVINFLILAGGLGYLIKRHAPAFFTSRSEAIRSNIAEARETLARAEQRARAIDERLARVSQEIADMRAQARTEMAAERARIEQQAEQRVRKILAQGEQEIAATAKAARLELRAYAASLAVNLAERRIAGRITAAQQRALVEDFARSLGGGVA